jgi:hypothetical protein
VLFGYPDLWIGAGRDMNNHRNIPEMEDDKNRSGVKHFLCFLATYGEMGLGIPGGATRKSVHIYERY